MSINMDIVEKQLQMGQVKTIRSNGGRTIDYTELLFSPNTKAQFSVDRINSRLNFTMNNVDLKYQDLNCSMSKDILRDLIISLKDLYNELNNGSEE